MRIHPAKLLLVLIVPAIVLTAMFLNPIHRRNTEALRTREFPRLANHCSECLRCRDRACGDSVPPLCEDGMELFRHDLRDRWER